MSTLMPDGAQLEADTAIGLLAGRLEVYHHHGEYDEPEAHQQRARIYLEQLRAGVVTAVGESLSARLAPGRRFALDEHPLDDLDGEYVVTRVEHDGRVPALIPAAGAPAGEDPGVDGAAVYQNRFACAPSGVIVRPEVHRHRIQQVTEVALVVGPPGEEIYTDEYGRIRVQFPWDREGQSDEHSSCWMRVSQAWAGATWGVQFVPRIGMEVLVTFLGGDVDRPVVTGCLYNALNPTTFDLPGDKSRSGFRTRSTPGGVGFNELSFEDATGSEQVYLHAQRDLDELVERDHHTRVKHDRRLEVDNDLAVSVQRNRAETVQGDHAETVGGDHGTRVDGSQTLTVRGGREVRVTQESTTRVEGRERREVSGAADHVYAQDCTTDVRGNATVRVGRADARRSHTVFVEGVAEVVGTTQAELSSEHEVLLRCGKSTLRLTPDAIELVAPTLRLRGAGAGADLGDDKLKLRSKASATLFTDKVLLQSSGGTVRMDNEVKVHGSQIHLRTPDNASESVDDKPVKPTAIELVDQNGNPLSYQRFVLRYGDGSEQGGILDKDGKAEIVLEQDAKVLFPDVSDAARS
jgi:type VI secretion system secreted protein VgrG